MKPVIFIVGWCGPKPTDYDSLISTGTGGYNIMDYWGKPLGAKGIPLMVLRWNEGTRNDDVTKMSQNIAAMVTAIKSKYGTQPVLPVGFSFGGCAALELAAALGSNCSEAFCLDPVDYRQTSKINTTGLRAPYTLRKVTCHHRLLSITGTKPSDAPNPVYSTFISGVNLPSVGEAENIQLAAQTQIVNIAYTKNEHGYEVWQHPTIDEVIAASLAA